MLLVCVRVCAHVYEFVSIRDYGAVFSMYQTCSVSYATTYTNTYVHTMCAMPFVVRLKACFCIDADAVSTKLHLHQSYHTSVHFMYVLVCESSSARKVHDCVRVCMCSCVCLLCVHSRNREFRHETCTPTLCLFGAATH